MPMTTSTTSDATPSGTDLLLRIGKGDPATWEEIVRRYGKIVSVTVRSFRLQDADALDAVQMTWLRLAENAHQVQLPERLGGWLTTTARRECLGILRHRVKLASQPFDAVTETVADPSVGPEQRVIDADTAQTLWKLVDELPPRRRTLLRALFTDNPAPYAQIAHIAGISPGAIGPTRARTLRQLRDRLEQHGLSCRVRH
ncbi:MAG TPA: sigma-70 family RNA polymerase sigma factor [Pseudonocardiaceae bacterium]|jgi:RNA polymerase sigma factor (sigma-70 family)|nr:sigma-70 family RNA polymerase sigma factor [Pseudonocardiaceae bacterium]